MNKKIVLIFLCLAMILCCSCSSVDYTRELPYTVDLNGYELPEAITLENNTDVYDERDIDNFLNYYLDGEAIGNNSVIILVEPINSMSYYWNQGEADKGGYTVTEMRVEALLEEGGGWNGKIVVGDTFKCIQLFTVQPNGKVVFPQYDYVDYINDKYISTQHSRKIMEIGKKYICCYSNNFVITADDHLGFVQDGGPDVGKFVCYYPKTFGGYGEACLLNGSKDVRSAKGIHFCRGYEFSEEAYEASKAIVEEYEAEGKTMADGSYYHYHGMVVEAWERYSGNANINDSE